MTEYTIYWITGHDKNVVRSNKRLPRDEVMDFIDSLSPGRCTGVYPASKENLF